MIEWERDRAGKRVKRKEKRKQNCAFWWISLARENSCICKSMANICSVERVQQLWKKMQLKCYQPILRLHAYTRTSSNKHLLVPCEANCLTEQRKHKNNLFFIAFHIIHGKIEWLARMLVAFFNMFYYIVALLCRCCVLSVQYVYLSRSVDHTIFSPSETNREILWNVRTNVPIAVFLSSVSIHWIPLIIRHLFAILFAAAIHPLKCVFFVFFFHFYNLLPPKFTCIHTQCRPNIE